MFSLERFLEYRCTVFIPGPQTPRKEVVNFLSGKSPCVRCITNRVRSGQKKNK